MGFQSSYSIPEFIDPFESPIDPKGSIWTTLATPMSREKQLSVSAVVKLKHVFEMLSSRIDLLILMLKSKAIHDIIHSNK
ncbi:hypothetical protein T08_3395 [Trichinella sp. T8]|nr:hypothetical protein T08_3395 [Trichinella sp. T8]